MKQGLGCATLCRPRRRTPAHSAYGRGVRLKFLLRPGWIAAILLIVVFSAICFTLLAPWQFSRNQEAQARNAAIQASYSAVPKPLHEVLPDGRVPDESTEWTQVTFRGSYLPEGETLAWLRTVQGEAALEVLTPFRLDDGRTVLVDRGYLRPINGTRLRHAAHRPADPHRPGSHRRERQQAPSGVRA
jgi:cytochrome oxidase assembly protein ShyY1